MAGNNRFKSRLANTLNNYIETKTKFLGSVNRDGNNLSIAANAKWDSFANTGLRRKEALVRNSVSHGMIRQDSSEAGSWFTGSASSYNTQMYSQLDATKANRIFEYRTMASYPDVNNALDEITNAFINLDEKGDCIKFKYNDKSASMEMIKELEDEFYDFISIFDFPNKGKQYCEDYLIDGELFLEYIINNDRPENEMKGILGVLKMPTELVEVLYTDRYNEIVGMFIGRDITVDDVNRPSQVIQMQQRPYQPQQIFYISSGQWDPTGQYIIPFIERARKRYIQLSFLEDAIIIYRLVRAPERLIFKADCGNMPAPEAEAYIRRLQQNFFKQKTFDINSGDIKQKFDAQTMLDAYWIATGAGNNGVEITQLPGGANLGQLDDLRYFQQALYRSMYVPVSRLKEDSQQSAADSTTILQEELKFAEKVIAIQRKFTPAIKQGFITHLKLKKIYDNLKIKERYIQIDFNPPSNYFRQRELQTAQLQAAVYNALSNNQQFSKAFLMKRIMGWTDADIAAQYALRKKEAANEFEITQITQNGPGWQSVMLAQSGGSGDMGGDMGSGDFGGGMDMSGGDMGGADFGGGGEELAAEMDENPGGDESL